MGAGTAQDALRTSTAVFVATAVAVRDTSVMYDQHGPFSQRIYTFRVESSWKGVSTELVDVITGLGGGDCGLSFRMRERYLVYSHRSRDEPGTLMGTGLCSRTAPRSAKSARSDVRALGRPARVWRR